VLPVAVETTNGVVVDRLLTAGDPVVPVHPNAFNATRPRWGAARAKSDPGDSWKLADLLRTDSHRLHRLRPLDAATLNLQALARLRDDHIAAKTAATNQLRALLDAHWPGAKATFARLDSPIALAFWSATPLHRRLIGGPGPAGRVLPAPRLERPPCPGGAAGRLRAAPVAGNSLDPKVLAACVGA
jgi:Transposase